MEIPESTPNGQSKAEDIREHPCDIPIYCFNNEELADVLGTNTRTLSRNIKGIRRKLGPYFLKWNIDQVAMIVEHWGTAPEKGQETDAA